MAFLMKAVTKQQRRFILVLNMICLSYVFKNKFNTKDMKGFNEKLGKNYRDASKSTSIKNVVNLSIVGAHLATSAGPVTGLRRAEEALNTLENVNIRHLRPCFFYSNLMANID